MIKSTNFAKALAFLMLLCVFSTVKAAAPRYYYQIRVYHLKTKAQEDRLDSYLKNAYLPALHRAGIPKAGVFKSMDDDTTGKKVYVFVPFTSWDKLENMDAKLSGDQQYLSDGKEFLEAAYNDLPYQRMETIVLKAFPKWPGPTEPKLTANKADRVYELRSYESPTENYNVNKMKMFNDGGETVLFNRLNFNAVFYAEVLAGSHMPNLMYMTTFDSKEEREKHWKAFFDAPEWKALLAMPKYEHNVSKVEITFLHPAEYSDY